MRKALVLFGNEIEREALIDSAIYLKKNLGFKLETLYIRDIAREKVMTTPDGLVMAGRVPLLYQGWNEVEKAEIESIKKCIQDKGLDEELVIDIGAVDDVVTEHMKTCDILIVGKNNTLGDREIDLLKANYKTMLLIGKKPLTSMDKVFIGNDNGVKVNRSCYHFIHLFSEITKFHSVTINQNIEENTLIEYMKQNNKEICHSKLDVADYETILEKISQADLFIMGNLSRSYFLEKIVGKNGVKLLEKGVSPIFIG